jgi:hypothetical protein
MTRSWLISDLNVTQSTFPLMRQVKSTVIEPSKQISDKLGYKCLNFWYKRFNDDN